MISAESLKAEELRLKYLRLIERPDVFPTRANWEYITQQKMPGLAQALYGKYLMALTVDDNDRELLHDIAIEEFPKFIGAIDVKEASEALYGDVTTLPEYTATLIRENGLFDAERLASLIDDGELNFVFSVIDVYKADYREEDLPAMELLMEKIDALPRLGSIEQRSGIFGKTEKYICPDGHVNSADTEYCHHAGCGKNARGLTEKQEAAIENYAGRVEALRSLIERMAVKD